MFDINTGLVFWTALSFLILVALLYKLVFPPLNKVLEQRRTAIEGRIEQARKAQEEAEGLLQKYRVQLSEAEKKTSEMFEDAQRKSAAIRDDGIKSAQKEARQIIENTKKDIDSLKRKSLGELKEEIADLVIEVNRKIIGKSLSKDEHAKLIDASIKELEKNAKSQV